MLPDLGVWGLKGGEETDALNGRRTFDVSGFEEGGGDIDAADEVGGWDPWFEEFCGPMGDEGGFHPRIVQAGFCAGEGAAIVCKDKDERVFQKMFVFERLDHDSDEMIESSDLVVIGCEVLSCFWAIDEVGRDEHVLGAVFGAVALFVPLEIPVPAAMRVGGGEPEEEGLIFWAVGKGVGPFGF